MEQGRIDPIEAFFTGPGKRFSADPSSGAILRSNADFRETFSRSTTEVEGMYPPNLFSLTPPPERAEAERTWNSALKEKGAHFHLEARFEDKSGPPVAMNLECQVASDAGTESVQILITATVAGEASAQASSQAAEGMIQNPEESSTSASQAIRSARSNAGRRDEANDLLAGAADAVASWSRHGGQGGHGGNPGSPATTGPQGSHPIPANSPGETSGTAPGTTFSGPVQIGETERTLHALIHASPLSIVAIDRNGQVRIWNPAAEALFRIGHADAVGRKLADLSCGWSAEDFSGLETALLEPCTAADSYVEMRRQTVSGDDMDIRVWCAPCFNTEAEFCGSVILIMDVTRQKFLERALLEASEREQRRIGQDLHDHLCQQLLGAAFAAKALAGKSDREGGFLSPDLHRLATVINDAVRQARDIARGLNPVEIDSAGLMAALQEMAARVRPPVHCELECANPVLLPDSGSALHAYRIAQEAVANAVKHARATRITIRLRETRDSVLLEIVDNGEGLAGNREALGMGIESMKFRAEAIGGKLAIESPAAGGTRIACLFPKRS